MIAGFPKIELAGGGMCGCRSRKSHKSKKSHKSHKSRKKSHKSRKGWG
jgi:hypothetical protein